MEGVPSCWRYYLVHKKDLSDNNFQGDIVGFSSLMFLLPEENVGFFWAGNRMLVPGPIELMVDPKTNALRQILIAKFMDKYFPPPPSPPPKPWSYSTKYSTLSSI